MTDVLQRRCDNRGCAMHNIEVKTDRSHCLGCDRKLTLVNAIPLSDDLLSGLFGGRFGR